MLSLADESVNSPRSAQCQEVEQIGLAAHLPLPANFGASIVRHFACAAQHNDLPSPQSFSNSQPSSHLASFPPSSPAHVPTFFLSSSQHPPLSILHPTPQYNGTIAFRRASPKSHKPSALVDVLDGRPFEVEVTVGNVLRMGRRVGQDEGNMARLRLVYGLLRVVQGGLTVRKGQDIA